MKMKRKAILGWLAFFLILSINVNASPNAAEETDMKVITKKVFPSVVRVEVRSTIRKVATGVVLDKQGHIVTTALVSPRDENIYIITSEGQKIDVEFLGMDSETHLAVLKAKSGKFTPIAMGDTKDVSAGSWVGVVGMSLEDSPQVTQGIVSSVGDDALRLNVWVWKGASGSPVVNDKGEMVGLLRGVYSDETPVIIQMSGRQVPDTGFTMNRVEAPSKGLAHAVPLSIVTDICAEIMEKGKVERGWLGVSIGEDEKGNVGLIDVEKDSPAEEAGLEVGDVIREFDGKSVKSSEMLVTEVRKRKPGETITLKIEREDKTQKVKLTLGEYTTQDIMKEFEMKFPTLFAVPESFPSEAGAPRVFRLPGEGPVPGVKFQRLSPFQNRKFIGIYLDEINEELSAYFGYKEGAAILINQIEKDTPAEKAGLKVGDLVISADGKRMQTTEDLIELIQGKEKGSMIRLEIFRDKKKMTIDVEVDVEESESSQIFPQQIKQFLESWDTSPEIRIMNMYRGIKV
ncbi:MAG: PDZ domain-containing protein [Candidatus Aminicenantes bacterium]|nr:PDZ domain-containing protein [Candidatus Aminicenantes bacterium]